jgi:hypothetical protein
LGWTYDAAQYALVRDAILRGLDVHAEPNGSAFLKDLVAFVQDQLGDHPQFPSRRMTNAARYVAADLQGRGILERVGRGSPQRLRRRDSPKGSSF